jgi:hypothetical protein
VHCKEGFVILQLAKKVAAQTHQRDETRIGNTLPDQLGEPLPLGHSADIELLRLIYIEKESRRLWLADFFVPPFGCVQQSTQAGLPTLQPIDPTFLPLLPFRVGGIVLPCSQKAFDQRPDRLGARFEREKTPSAITRSPCPEPDKRLALAERSR